MVDPVLSDFWQYSFPPFFTIQPNLETRKVQLETWTSLVLSYCKRNCVFKLDINNALHHPLFENNSISRRLDLESLMTVLDFMKEQGKLEWIDKAKKQAFVLWHSPREWSKILYDWAVESGNTNSVSTFFEITSGDHVTSCEFYKMDLDFLRRVLRELEKDGKAVIIDPSNDGGVKFL